MDTKQLPNDINMSKELLTFRYEFENNILKFNF